MNVLILAAGQATFDSHDGGYPLCLTELAGSPLIERVFSACSTLHGRNIVVAVKEQHVKNFHLDNTIRVLDSSAHIVAVKENTRGAACTALLAVEHIDNDQPLLILNGNEFVEADFFELISSFKNRMLDVGVVTFPSVHPRYSYVRVDENGYVIEAAEKNPISRRAVAGFYWYKNGSEFVGSVKEMIRKDASVGDVFYITPSLNELILNQAKIGCFDIEAQFYHPLKTERQVLQFESIKDLEAVNGKR